MDLRFPVLAILCGGAPAPGINGVISSVTIEALNSNCSVLGFFEGFKQLKLGKSMAMDILFNDVTRIHSTGGSMLRTSKQQLSTPQHVDNCLRVLQHHRVRYLVTVGGTQTAYSASLIVNAAAAAKYKLSVVYVCQRRMFAPATRANLAVDPLCSSCVLLVLRYARALQTRSEIHLRRHGRLSHLRLQHRTGGRSQARAELRQRRAHDAASVPPAAARAII
jgi:hypothetical protein